MKGARVFVAVLGFALTAAGSAPDPVVALTLDGRPVDRDGGVAVLHAGLVYADAIDLTKSFNGFITLTHAGAATITIGPNTGTFTPGSLRATIDNTIVALPGAPFMRGGQLFVPLQAFSSRIAGATVRFDAVLHRADIRVNTRVIH